MTRRPHWDDDLVDAVIDLQYHCVDCIGDDYPDIDQRDPDAVNKAWAHAIIAAVEDWQDRTQQARATSKTDNEAAIARVREVCERDSFWLNDTDSFGTSRALTVSQVLKALDSDQ